MKKQIRIYIYIIGLILIDQLSKVWALSALRGTEGIAVIPNVFELSSSVVFSDRSMLRSLQQLL